MHQNEEPLERYLERKQVVCSQNAITQYYNLFRKNYVHLECILECSTNKTFDEALTHFLKFYRIDVID